MLPVEMRPIEPADADALLRFHAGLSTETTRLRYFSPHPRLTSREVGHFTVVDHCEREAIVAVVDGEIVAVARYEPTSVPGCVEVAFVVADAWQHHGIGTALLARLADRARAEGVTTMVAETLSENHSMLDVFAHSGFTPTHTWDHGVVHCVMTLALQATADIVTRYESEVDEPTTGTRS